jgi:hypothetical protein
VRFMYLLRSNLAISPATIVVDGIPASKPDGSVAQETLGAARRSVPCQETGELPKTFLLREFVFSRDGFSPVASGASKPAVLANGLTKSRQSRKDQPSGQMPAVDLHASRGRPPSPLRVTSVRAELRRCAFLRIGTGTPGQNSRHSGAIDPLGQFVAVS